MYRISAGEMFFTLPETLSCFLFFLFPRYHGFQSNLVFLNTFNLAWHHFRWIMFLFLWADRPKWRIRLNTKLTLPTKSSDNSSWASKPVWKDAQHFADMSEFCQQFLLGNVFLTVPSDMKAAATRTISLLTKKL